MAVIVYVSIFPQNCLICVHMPISGLPFPLFYWCNSMYMPNARVSVCTVRRRACFNTIQHVCGCFRSISLCYMRLFTAWCGVSSAAFGCGRSLTPLSTLVVRCGFVWVPAALCALVSSATPSGHSYLELCTQPMYRGFPKGKQCCHSPCAFGAAGCWWSVNLFQSVFCKTRHPLPAWTETARKEKDRGFQVKATAGK